MYYRSIKKLAYNHHQQESDIQEISSKFLCPIVKHVKVTQYGNDAIIVVTGQKLWFVYSLKLTSAVCEPFQLQETSVSFKANMQDIVHPDNLEDNQVMIYSHFCPPLTVNFSMELNVSIFHSSLCIIIYACFCTTLKSEWEENFLQTHCFLVIILIYQSYMCTLCAFQICFIS